MQESVLSDQRSNVQTQIDRVSGQIKTLDETWKSHKDELISQRQAKRSQDASAASAANQAIESNLGTEPATAQSVKTVHAYLDRQKHGSIPEIDEARRTAKVLIQELSLADPNDLNAYVENWHTSYLNSLPEAISPDELRNVIQPDLEPGKNSLQGLNDSLAAIQQQLQSVQRQEEYHPSDFLLDVIKGILTFVFFVWGLGLLLEALLLGVFIARDVHLIRLEKCPPTSAITPEQS